jgi:hypothetical protein
MVRSTIPHHHHHNRASSSSGGGDVFCFLLLSFFLRRGRPLFALLSAVSIGQLVNNFRIYLNPHFFISTSNNQLFHYFSISNAVFFVG